MLAFGGDEQSIIMLAIGSRGRQCNDLANALSMNDHSGKLGEGCIGDWRALN